MASTLILKFATLKDMASFVCANKLTSPIYNEDISLTLTDVAGTDHLSHMELVKEITTQHVVKNSWYERGQGFSSGIV